MKILKVKKKADNIYEILYTKGWLIETYRTDDVHIFLGEVRYCKNGYELGYYVSTSIKYTASMLKNIGDEYIIEGK